MFAFSYLFTSQIDHLIVITVTQSTSSLDMEPCTFDECDCICTNNCTDTLREATVLWSFAQCILSHCFLHICMDMCTVFIECLLSIVEAWFCWWVLCGPHSST